MSRGDGFRQRALGALERAEQTSDPAARRELGKLADSYINLAEQADGMQAPATRYPGDDLDDPLAS
jgi:hypothetical protein